MHEFVCTREATAMGYATHLQVLERALQPRVHALLEGGLLRCELKEMEKGVRRGIDC